MLDTLKVNSEVLDNIHQRFTNDVSTKGIQIHSFQEAKGMSGMRGFHNKVCRILLPYDPHQPGYALMMTPQVVDDFSSKLDLPSTLETVETIEADHREMARYSSREEEGYRAILGVLRDFVRRGLGRQEVAVTGTADQS